MRSSLFVFLLALTVLIVPGALRGQEPDRAAR